MQAGVCVYYVMQAFTLPLSRTRIRSQSRTVLMRWAMVSMVQCWKASLMVC